MPMKLEGPSPIACPECEGQGGREYDFCPVNGCPGPRSPEGCTHAQTGWEKCAECAGTGHTRCSLCDCNTAVMMTPEGVAACQTCGLEAEGQLRLRDVA